jgi:Holliday junction resolvasome RuvABC ATP-dependent DNA helicase subunit
MTASLLAEALARVRAAGAAAGLDADEVNAEATTLAAAVCAASPEAARAWAATFGRERFEFSGAAYDGLAWEKQPTPLVIKLLSEGRAERALAYGRALAALAVEACTLDPDPSLAGVHTAERFARTQLNAVKPPAPPEPAPPAARPAEPDATLPELLARLDRLVGLKTVKEQVHRQVALLRVNELRMKKNLKAVAVTRHLVFVGNPGTGKTTVARLVAAIYRALGLLENGTLIETDRSGLVAGYVGQTALKTADVVKRALGGVLFVDEAYALASDQFGKESVDTLVKAMEDNRDSLVVIVAGYPEPMQEFIETNPGLESRFGTTIVFPDYTEDELIDIFEQMCLEGDFTPTDGCVSKVRDRIRREPRDTGFGNARFVRNIFEAALSRQAWRLRTKESPTEADLRRLRAEDVPAE